MAKAKKEEVVNTSTKENTNENDLFKLLQYEQATKILVQIYENSIRNYDGSVNSDNNEYNKYKKYTNIHNLIIQEIENTVDKKYEKNIK